jgi:hypothetical protein
LGEKKKDFHFTIHAFKSLLKSESLAGIDHFIFWSDNGLKVKEIIHYFSKSLVEMKKYCHFHFFAPYHGHSVCDAHFGKGKEELRANVADGVLLEEEEVINSFNSLENTEIGIFF